MIDTEINYSTKLDSSTISRAPLLCSATLSAWGIDKLQGFNTIWKSQLEASAPALDVHQVVNGLRQENRLYHHLFYNFTTYANSEVF